MSAEPIALRQNALRQELRHAAGSFCGEVLRKAAVNEMRFYFDVHHDQEIDRDTLGIEAPSLDAAVRYVVATVQDFISEERPLAARINRAMVEITDRKDTSAVVSCAQVFHKHMVRREGGGLG